MTGVVVTAIVALTASYPLGPRQHLGDWVADQVRFTRAWVRGGTVRQAVVVQDHVVTVPRTNWRLMRAPAIVTRVPVPVRDPDRTAHHARGEHE